MTMTHTPTVGRHERIDYNWHRHSRVGFVAESSPRPCPPDEPGPGGSGRSLLLTPARVLPDPEGTPDNTVQLVAVPPSENVGGVDALCGVRLRLGSSRP